MLSSSPARPRMNAGTGSQDRRSQTRQDVGWQGRLTHDGDQISCVVTNISCTGVHIESARPLTLDSEVSIDIANLGEFSGTVVWRDGDHYGVKFHSFSSLVWQFLGCWSTFESMSKMRGA